MNEDDICVMCPYCSERAELAGFSPHCVCMNEDCSMYGKLQKMEE